MYLFNILLLALIPCLLQAQIQQFPYTEKFDSVTPPALPLGWSSSRNRSASGDFVTARSSPHSDSNAILSTNAATQQTLTSAIFDFSNVEPESLTFYERRSASHNSGLLIEVSTDGGSVFTAIGDTINNPGVTAYVPRKLRLSHDLQGQISVRFRWHILGNGSGTSGTLRLDDIVVTALLPSDVGINSLRFDPPHPAAGESVYIRAAIMNGGSQNIQNIPVNFYEDTDFDSAFEVEELFEHLLIEQVILPGDSLVVRAKRDNLAFGNHLFMVKTEMEGDRNPSNDMRIALLQVGLRSLSLVINEIMYAPLYGGPEWIELYNNSDYKVDLEGWKISNRNTTSLYLISPVTSIIDTHKYSVITKDSSLLRSISPLIPSDIIQASTMPSFLFNNSGDAVVLFDQEGRIIDSIRYSPSWGGTGGKSLERVEATSVSNDSSNWGNSRDPLGSTPGIQNYLTPLDSDLRISLPDVFSSDEIGVYVYNAGRKPSGTFWISLYKDSNRDSIPQESEFIEKSAINSPLPPKDSVMINLNFSNQGFGEIPIIAVLDYPEDMRSSDNTAYGSAQIAYPDRTLVINEIMYDPKVGGSEYIELLNISAQAADVCKWKISDIIDTAAQSKAHLISQSTACINAGEYLVIAQDSTVLESFPYLLDSSYRLIIKRGCFTLNNGGDDIILRDLTGKTIDSLHYLPGWHNPGFEDFSGRSLERINPYMPSNERRNWSTSANPAGGTPGRENSIYTLSVPPAASLSFSPNPFSPDGDGFEDFTIIGYRLPAAAVTIRLRIFDSSGRIVRTLASGEPSGASGETIWDGFSDQAERVRMGIYIILLEALDASTGSVQTLKGVVVVAAKL